LAFARANQPTVPPEPSPPVLGQPVRLSGNLFRFQLSGQTGQNYIVQVSTNLGLTNWLTLVVTNLSASPVLIQDSQATDQERFYRVIAP
jgi:Tfp pilus tip-associated adhesin PilY1